MKASSTEARVTELSKSIAGHVATVVEADPKLSPEHIVAATVDFLAVCLSSLPSPDPMVRSSLIDVIVNTIKDRVVHYDRIPTRPCGLSH